jgi:hypothetical protein
MFPSHSLSFHFSNVDPSSSILTTVFVIAGVFLIGELVTAVPDDIGKLDLELNAEDFDADYLFHSDKQSTEQNEESAKQ